MIYLAFVLFGLVSSGYCSQNYYGGMYGHYYQMKNLCQQYSNNLINQEQLTALVCSSFTTFAPTTTTSTTEEADIYSGDYESEEASATPEMQTSTAATATAEVTTESEYAYAYAEDSDYEASASTPESTTTTPSTTTLPQRRRQVRGSKARRNIKH